MVNKVAIVTDTTACIPQEQVAQYDIEVVPIEFIFGDKVYRDGIDMSSSDFYTRLRQAKKTPTTSGSSPSPFLEAFRQASRKSADILCITLAAHLSGMFNSAQLAKRMAKDAMPDINIEVLDCRTAAAAQGLIVLAAAKAAAQGKSLTEVTDTARDVMKRVKLFASLDTLYYLVKGGRVPKAAALASSLLKIKPIFTINDGDASPVTNPRTTPGAIKRLIKLMAQNVVKGKPLHVAVMHANAPNEAKKISDLISAQFNCAELLITEFTPVMGVHTGPGLFGVAFYSED